MSHQSGFVKALCKNDGNFKLNFVEVCENNGNIAIKYQL